jgi:hypothetical protein
VGKDKDGNESFKAIDTIELTPAQQTEAVQAIVNIAAANNFELTNENLQSLVDAQKSILAFKNYGASVEKYVSNRLAEEKLAWEKGLHNPSGSKIDIPAGEQGTNFDKDFLSKADKLFGKS